MLIKTRNESRWISCNSLWDALGMPDKPHLAVSLVGGGGKTNVMYRLAEELAGRGRRVIVTTSTHIFLPTDRQVALATEAETVKQWIWEMEGNRAAGAAFGQIGSWNQKGWILVTGQLVPEREFAAGQPVPGQQPASQRKLTGLPLPEISKLKDFADVLLIEADGARRLPIKVPREGEPVLIPETDVVVGCAGLDCVGKPISEVCLRAPLAERLLGKPMESLMTPEDVAMILASEAGTRKGVENREFRVALNKADDQERMQKACEIIQRTSCLLKEAESGEVGMVVTRFDICEHSLSLHS